MEIRGILLISLAVVFLMGIATAQFGFVDDTIPKLEAIANTSAGGSSSNVTNFTQLLDTPSSYTTASGKCVTVKVDETGLEFIDCPGGTDTQKKADGVFLYNDTTTIFFNDTKMNLSLDGRYVNVIGDTMEGNLSFSNNYSILVGANKYAFRLTANPLAGVYFDANRGQYIFYTTAGNESFRVGASGSTPSTFLSNTTYRACGSLSTTSTGQIICNVSSGGSQGWDDVLIVDANTNGNDPTITSGDKILFGNTETYIELLTGLEGTQWVFSTTTPWINLSSLNRIILDAPIIDTKLERIINVQRNPSKGDVIWYNGTGWQIAVKPTTLVTPGDTFTLYSNSTNDTYFAASGGAPSLSQVLAIGSTTEANNITFTTDSRAIFRNSNHSIYSPSNGQLIISSSSATNISGDFKISQGNYRVSNNQYAFQADSSTNVGQFFNSSANEIQIKSNTNRPIFGISVVNTNAAAYFLGNLNPAARLAIGTNTFGGMAIGDLNVSTVYYNTLVQKSPQIFCDNYGVVNRQKVLYCNAQDKLSVLGFEFSNVDYKVTTDDHWNILWSDQPLSQRVINKFNELKNSKQSSEDYERDKAECEALEYNSYVNYEEYLQGSRTCTFHPEVADEVCIRDFGEFYRWESGQCIIQQGLLCESVEWQVWNPRLRQCLTNDMVECDINGATRNESWDYRSSACRFDESIECRNRGDGWSWESNQCFFDGERQQRTREQQCREMGRCFVWEDNQCRNLCE